MIHNIPEKDIDAFLSYLRDNERFLDTLRGSIDNAHLFGREENASRFIAEITNLWKRSSFSDPAKYVYKNTAGILNIKESDNIKDPFSFWYEITKKGAIINVNIRRKGRQIIRSETNYEYDMYQPVVVLFASDNKWEIPTEPMPAYVLYLAKNIKDNKKTIEAANLTLDIALTFSGVGNISKLKNIPSALRKAKVLIGATEVAASTIDIYLNYTDICKGHEETCRKIKIVTFALQMASLSADIISSQKIRQYAKEAAESANTTNTALPKELAKTLEDLGGVKVKNVVAEVGGKFTTKQVDDYVIFATKQNNKSKVMLGMWDGGGSSSYISKAGKEYTYFDFGDKWDEAYNIVNKNDDEIWRINKKFIDNQKAAGKEFWFSHNPFSPKNEQFFAREVNYLIDLGVKDFKKVGNLWKAVW